MNLAFKYPLYPNRKQERTLYQWAGSCRWIWNKFLDRNKMEHEDTGNSYSTTTCPAISLP
ncbi:MAG: helix-turn-helix domain-containing protein [Deltaproteobacteria bacterium]|nr:helix-turn-helix domain-containing protein [Deltaproteobacteria bacterium]